MAETDTTTPWGQAPLPTPLPWQQPLWQQLTEQHQQQHLSHAYLVSGEPGSGVQQFLTAVAVGLLCRQPEGLLACGHCKSCLLLAAGTHPDVQLLMPQDSRQLKIDQIRTAIEAAAMTAQQGGYRVIIILPAEAMNRHTANALLKLLEEPGANTVLLLGSYAPATIAPTVRSRCQKLTLPPPTAAAAQIWLQSQGIDNASLNPDYLRRPLAVMAEQQQTDSPPVYDTVQQAWQQLQAGSAALEFARKALRLEHLTEAEKKENQKNKVKIQPFDPLTVADALYSILLGDIKTGKADTAAFAALDSLVELRRILLSGGNVNIELYLQAWVVRYIKG